MKKEALVLLSGGQDSTTCLLWAIQKWGQEKVEAIAFFYGQKHKIELEQARKIADEVGVAFEIVDVRGILGESSLTNHSLDHNTTKNDLPASFTPGRNALFLTIAGIKAWNKGITDIVTGVCETDFSGYPDCRQNFVTAQQYALNMAMDSRSIMIHTPLMYLSKAQTWALAKDLGEFKVNDRLINCLELVKTMTMTDYNGDTTMNEWGMGKEDNPASVLRAKGYREAVAAGMI